MCAGLRRTSLKAFVLNFAGRLPGSNSVRDGLSPAVEVRAALRHSGMNANGFSGSSSSPIISWLGDAFGDTAVVMLGALVDWAAGVEGALRTRRRMGGSAESDVERERDARRTPERPRDLERDFRPRLRGGEGEGEWERERERAGERGRVSRWRW